jgi:glycosyltransferase involved in cell wall biosynthesis
MTPSGKVALVHDWLTGMRGGEKCLEAFCELFPQADLYTLIYLPDRVSPTIRAMNVRPSWINRLPAVERYYRYYLPLFPRAIERFDLKDYDLVLSSSHCVAKGVLPKRALHIAYIHSPMRYVWDQHDVYFGPETSWISRAGMALWRKYLQQWDLRSSERVNFFVANSNNVAAKIKRLYGREATVIHPPVDITRFNPDKRQGPYYLVVSALVPYKKIDIAIEAFNRLKLPLKIAGEGPLRRKLEKLAGPNIEFLGWVDDQALPDLYAGCRALIFPGEEDFGIVPLEAQASGRPVIAYGRGGVLETVLPLKQNAGARESAQNPTGIFFHQLTSESLMEAVHLFQETKYVFEPAAIRHHASNFSRDRFKVQMKDYLAARLRDYRAEK